MARGTNDEEPQVMSSSSLKGNPSPSKKLPIRIAVLECDTPLERTRFKYGGYGGVFIALLHAGADALDLPRKSLEITSWDIVNKSIYPQLEDVDAVLMTGSRFSAFDDSPWLLDLVEFTRKILRQKRVKIIGVCFGHQIVGRAMNANVARNVQGWEVSVCEVKLTGKGREMFGKDTLNIHQMHKDIVYSYPDDVEKLGSSATCEVQGMYIPQKVITIQGHPEFNQEIVTELLETRHKQHIFDDGTFQDALSRVDKPQDGVTVAKAFLRFVLDQ